MIAPFSVARWARRPLALLANLGFVALALILVLALPRTIPGHE